MTFLDRMGFTVVLTSAAVAAGCGEDLFGAGADEAALSGDDSNSAEGGTETDTATEEDGSDIPGDFPPCETNCSGVGACRMYEDTPVCLCEEGYVSGADDCLPCPAVGDILHVEANSVTFSGDILLNGEPPPASVYQDAQLYVRDIHGNLTPLAQLHEGHFSSELLPGAYEIVYSHLGGDDVPQDSAAVLGRIWLDASREQTVEIDARPLVGNFTINGEAPPTSSYEYGNIVLVEVESGNELLLGATRAQSYATMVIPGSYEIHYRRVDGGELVPANTDAPIGTLDVESGRSTLEFDINVAMAPLSGNLTIAGATPPESIYERAELYLVSLGEGADEVLLTDTNAPDFAVNVVPGAYDLEYRLGAGGALVPANPRARFSTIAAGEILEQDIDIPAVTVEGTFSIAGAEAPQSPYDDGRLFLRGFAGQEAVLLGNTASGSYSALVLPGDYQLVYAAETVGTDVPANVGAVIEVVSLYENTTKAIDIPRVSISGAFTITGETPPTSVYDSGRVYLRDLETGDSALLGDTREGGYSVFVAPGRYGIYYARENANGLVPENENGLVQEIILDTDTELDIDVPMYAIDGDVRVNDEAAPTNASDSARLHLRTRASEDSLLLTDSNLGPFETRLVRGTYDIVYTLHASSGAVPENTSAVLTCVAVE